MIKCYWMLILNKNIYWNCNALPTFGGLPGFLFAICWLKGFQIGELSRTLLVDLLLVTVWEDTIKLSVRCNSNRLLVFTFFFLLAYLYLYLNQLLVNLILNDDNNLSTN